MSDKFYLGNRAISAEISPEYKPYSKVVIIAGEDEEGNQLIYEAGDDSGLTLEVENPWGTQQIANDMLARIKGYSYRPFVASGAMLPPEAELGDGVTLNGVYSVFAAEETVFNAQYMADVSAPADGEIDHEYPYEAIENREISRKISEVRTALRVSVDSISAEVAGKIGGDDAQTLISQNINGITLSASAGQNQSTITLRANGVFVDSVVAQFSNIVADAIVANSSITSPQIIGGRYWDASQQASLYLQYSGGTGRVMYGAGSITSIGNAYFGVYGDYIGSNVELYLAGKSVFSSSFSTDNFTVAAPMRVNEKIILSSENYGTTLPTDGLENGRLFFLI